MKPVITLNDITIRTELKSGDIGQITFLHGILYKEEHSYSISFESYVAKGLYEFYHQYHPEKDRVWVCEHTGTIIGFILLMHRNDTTAQLRYFILRPEYRGIGLGKHLMNLYMEFLKEKGYHKSYLWTTDELVAAASLYKRHGFVLTDEKESTDFGKALREQRYDLILK
ncbi:MAG TPA: GNAT family N-acetyltransferase [Flavitalea sp.]|nr:GNAT family N-acetyltransferase [Flavitalea sp.]